MPKNRTMLVPMIFPQDLALPSPSFCPSRMVVPIASELISPVTVCMICEPIATPETSCAKANLPTTIRSTAPYSACKKSAKRIGIENLSSGPTMGPRVKSMVRSITINTSKKSRISK